MGPVPEATIVVTTHDRPELARRAIASALGQTIGAVEVVVVDDGSEPPFGVDGLDARVRVVRNESPRGVTAARNVGLAHARGGWVTFLDDDDELVPEMLERCLAAASASTLPQPVAVNAAVTIVGEGAPQTLVPAAALSRGEDYFLEGSGDAGRTANALVVPVAVLRSVGGFDEAYETFEHDDLGLRLNAVASIQGLDQALYRMYSHGSPRLSQRQRAIPAAMERTLVKHAAAFSRHPVGHARFLGSLGYRCLEAGDWGAAVRWSWRGVRRNPRDRRTWFYLATALAGPWALRFDRRLRPRASTVGFLTLMRSRVRKYGRRALDHPRWVLAGPVAAFTRAVAARRVPRTSTRRARRVLFLSVYRAKNDGVLRPLVEEARSRGWDVRLWAFDEPTPGLAADTVGQGADAKFPLLNALLAGCRPDGYDWVVCADDDFRFEGGSLEAFLALAEAGALELVQPAHVERSFRDHEFTVRRPLSLARRTTFVEIGPVFAVHRDAVARVLPFPREHAMGWGLELDWYALERDGLRLGIVDGAPIRHLQPVGAGYSKAQQREQLDALLAARGVGSVAAIQHVTGTWRPWRPRPPWAVREARAEPASGSRAPDVGR